jgi:hypothetical protein
MRFEALRERLLKGGIAPRHVRRYLRELEEHYADLHAAQREAGFDEVDAMARARALLGEDENLAKAMLEQRDFRAISARFRWLVFPLAPGVTVFIGLLLPVLLMMGIIKTYGLWIGAEEFAVPGWYRLLAESLFGFVNFATMPLTMLLLSVLVWRQRLSVLWLLPCLVLLLPLVAHATGDFPSAAGILQHQKNALSVGVGFRLGLDKLWQEAAAGNYWPLLQDVLILLPPAILLLRRRGLAKVPLSS